MIWSSLVVLVFASVVRASPSIDSHFGIEPEDIQLKEISDNVRRVSGAVMGMAEYIIEIRQEVKDIRELVRSRNVSNARPDSYFSRPLRNPEEIRRQSLELADKVERLLAMDQSPEVDLAKEELKRTVEKNFLRMLAAILITGPAHTQQRSDDIFKLMRSVLNGELDFTPVVQRLPLILRDSETNQFVNLLITLRESERGGAGVYRKGVLNTVENTVVNGTIESYYRQNNVNVGSASGTNNNNVGVNNGQGTGVQNVRPTANPNQLPSLNSILDAIQQTNDVLTQIPTLIEGLQTIVETLEGLAG